MSIKDKIEQLKRHVKAYETAISLLEKIELDDSIVDKIQLFSDRLDFDFLTHDQVIQVIKVFGGKWEKTPNGTNIDYVLKHESGIQIQCYAGEAPPSCKIVEEKVYVEAVEAHYATVRKLVCSEPVS